MLMYIVVTVEYFVDLAFHKTALHVCKIVLSERSFLFPDVYKVFLTRDVDHPTNTSKSMLLTFLEKSLVSY